MIKAVSMSDMIFGEKKTAYAISSEEIDESMAELRESIEKDMFKNERNEAKSLESAMLKLHLRR